MSLYLISTAGCETDLSYPRTLAVPRAQNLVPFRRRAGPGFGLRAPSRFSRGPPRGQRHHHYLVRPAAVPHSRRALHHLRHPGQDLEKLIPQDLRGLSVELIDLRTIVPYDVSRRDQKILSGIEANQLSLQIETVVKSVNKTGRCMIVHEAPSAGSVASELAAEIQQRCFLRLEAPVKRLTGWDTPFGVRIESFPKYWQC